MLIGGVHLQRSAFIYPPRLNQYAAVNLFVSFSTSFILFFFCFDHLETGEEENVQAVDRR